MNCKGSVENLFYIMEHFVHNPVERDVSVLMH